MILNSETLELCRSLLFIPATEEKFITKAHQRGAGAVILDLEDAVAPANKIAARKIVTEMAARLQANGIKVLVRINAESVEDVEAAVSEHVLALVIPKAESADDIHKVSAILARREAELGLEVGHTHLLVLIETPTAVCNAHSIACADERISGLILGSEDLALALDVDPCPESLQYAAAQVVMAARAAGKVPLGVPGSLATITESERFREVVALGQKIGMAGTVCIHPNQVAVVRDIYISDSQKINDAKDLLRAFDEAESSGKGAVMWNGKMLDAPIVERARKLVSRHEA